MRSARALVGPEPAAQRAGDPVVLFGSFVELDLTICQVPNDRSFLLFQLRDVARRHFAITPESRLEISQLSFLALELLDLGAVLFHPALETAQLALPGQQRIVVLLRNQEPRKQDEACQYRDSPSA